jgi:hypothetical protein
MLESATVEKFRAARNLPATIEEKFLTVRNFCPQDELYTTIRNNRFVELPYAELDESERRAMYVNLFNIYE